MDEKKQLINLISNTEDENIIHYLYMFSSDFISCHSDQQTSEPCLKGQNAVRGSI